MSIKKTIYPKTKRTGSKYKYIVTEKIDGSNLGLFKLDDQLYVAQRNNVFNWETESDELKANGYKGLYGWVSENVEVLKNSIGNNQAIFGEWVGMGRIKYDGAYGRFNMFAKARIDEDFNVDQLNYNLEFFKYGFTDSEFEIPECIDCVKVVTEFDYKPSIADLDKLYDDYCNETDHNVEGFIIISSLGIEKYVRLKNGTTVEPHYVGKN